MKIIKFSLILILFLILINIYNTYISDSDMEKIIDNGDYTNVEITYDSQTMSVENFLKKIENTVIKYDVSIYTYQFFIEKNKDLLSIYTFDQSNKDLKLNNLNNEYSYIIKNIYENNKEINLSRTYTIMTNNDDIIENIIFDLEELEIQCNISDQQGSNLNDNRFINSELFKYNIAILNVLFFTIIFINIIIVFNNKKIIQLYLINGRSIYKIIFNQLMYDIKVLSFGLIIILMIESIILLLNNMSFSIILDFIIVYLFFSLVLLILNMISYIIMYNSFTNITLKNQNNDQYFNIILIVFKLMIFLMLFISMIKTLSSFDYYQNQLENYNYYNTLQTNNYQYILNYTDIEKSPEEWKEFDQQMEEILINSPYLLFDSNIELKDDESDSYSHRTYVNSEYFNLNTIVTENGKELGSSDFNSKYTLVLPIKFKSQITSIIKSVNDQIKFDMYNYYYEENLNSDYSPKIEDIIYIENNQSIIDYNSGIMYQDPIFVVTDELDMKNILYNPSNIFLKDLNQDLLTDEYKNDLQIQPIENLYYNKYKIIIDEYQKNVFTLFISILTLIIATYISIKTYIFNNIKDIFLKLTKGDSIYYIFKKIYYIDFCLMIVSGLFILIITYNFWIIPIALCTMFIYSCLWVLQIKILTKKNINNILKGGE